VLRFNSALRTVSEGLKPPPPVGRVIKYAAAMLIKPISTPFVTRFKNRFRRMRSREKRGIIERAMFVA
jgi:hypothetical protein